MSQKIILHPELNLSAEQFADAWNSSAYAEQYGRAETAPQSKSISYDLGSSLILIATATSMVLTPVLQDFLKELLKEAFIPKDNKTVSPKITTTTIEDGDGNVLLVIKKEETGG